MERIQVGLSYRAGVRQVPDRPSVPTTVLADDLYDPKSSTSSLQSFAYPCCNYWLPSSDAGMD